MTEQNYNVDQSADPEAQPAARTMSSAAPETPTGDMGVKTPLDYLRDAFAKEIESEPITLEIPNRPGIWIEFSTNVTSEEFELWRKQATVSSRRRGADADIDNTKFSALVIFHKALIFEVDGQGVYLAPGETRPLNFFEQSEIRKLVGTNATTNTELVRAVYANDAHVLAAGQQIIEAAGYGEELAEFKESPTRR